MLKQHAQVSAIRCRVGFIAGLVGVASSVIAHVPGQINRCGLQQCIAAVRVRQVSADR